MGKPPVNLSQRVPPAGAIQKYGFALLLYVVLSGYLFHPYLRTFSMLQWLNVINPVAAAWGAFFLSRRWIHHWTPSVLAGAVYGFSPFALSFAVFPVAGLSYMMVPWLFLPSVFWHRHSSADAIRFLVRLLCAFLPFAGIALLFWASSQKWAGPHFLMPVNLHLVGRHFYDLVFPLFRAGPYLTFGIYHAPLILCIMGLFVLVSIQRISVVFPVAAALILCFLEPVFQVSPLVWAAIPILFLAILAGLGFQSVLLASRSDAKWILVCAIAASILAAFFGGLGYKRLVLRGLLEWTALMYALIAVAMWILLLFAKTGHRWPWSRWIVLCAAAIVDIVLSARYLVDKLL